jgi:hypothetical protein
LGKTELVRIGLPTAASSTLTPSRASKATMFFAIRLVAQDTATP